MQVTLRVIRTKPHVAYPLATTYLPPTTHKASPLSPLLFHPKYLGNFPIPYRLFRNPHMEFVAVGFALNKLYDLLAKGPLDERYKPFRDYTKNLRKLESTLSAVHASLKAAHRRHIAEPDILNWISKLKDASFDADDVLDATVSEALLRRAHLRSFPGKLVAFFSHRNPILFRCRIGYRIERVLERLGDVADEKKFQIGGGGGSATCAAEERQTHSSAPDTVVGREVDRNKVLNLLLGTGEAEGFGVVAIVGMGGSGKTTLAQMVVKEYPLNQSDEERIWVYVGQDFSLRRIAKGVLEGMGRRLEFTELEGVKRSLVEVMNGKKVLLVLDDVWNERKEVWVDVEELLRCGARGSRVLVTTRSERVAAVMCAEVHRMQALSAEDCWSLLKQRAFGGRVEEPAANLVQIGKEIAEKSKGLPLVANVLGGLMIDKTQLCQWLEVRDNEIWDCLRDEQEDEKEIHPALRLSYFHLPLRSKPCFAYCALFHKGYNIDREKVIQQWVANGFVPMRGRRTLESIGEEIFDDLVARGLLHEYGEKDQRGNATSYRMHDMVHDLATFLTKNECHILTEYSQINKDYKRIRFLSIHAEPSVETLEVLCKIRKSRTLVVTSGGQPSINVKLLKGVFRSLKLLRVLDLSSCDVKEIPKGIGDLIHLRYIDFSNTGLTSLPGEICSLINLKILRLRNCNITQLPKGIGDLIHLRYIDFSNTGLTSLPGEICSLINLKILRLRNCNITQLPRGLRGISNLVIQS